jgi:hypothetical protein
VIGEIMTSASSRTGQFTGAVSNSETILLPVIERSNLERVNFVATFADEEFTESILKALQGNTSLKYVSLGRVPHWFIDPLVILPLLRKYKVLRLSSLEADSRHLAIVLRRIREEMKHSDDAYGLLDIESRGCSVLHEIFRRFTTALPQLSEQGMFERCRDFFVMLYQHMMGGKDVETFKEALPVFVPLDEEDLVGNRYNRRLEPFDVYQLLDGTPFTYKTAMTYEKLVQSAQQVLQRIISRRPVVMLRDTTREDSQCFRVYHDYLMDYRHRLINQKMKRGEELTISDEWFVSLTTRQSMNRDLWYRFVPTWARGPGLLEFIQPLKGKNDKEADDFLFLLIDPRM